MAKRKPKPNRRIGRSFQASKPFPFLSLPLDIRRMIYDYFLPEKFSFDDNRQIHEAESSRQADTASESYLASFGSPNFPVHNSDLHGSVVENEDSSYFPYNCQVEKIFHVYKRLHFQSPFLRTLLFPPTPAIVRACRQTYDEGMSVICSPTFTILISSSGIFLGNLHITFQPGRGQSASGVLKSTKVLQFFRGQMRRIQHLRILYLVDDECLHCTGLGCEACNNSRKFFPFLAAAYGHLVRQLLDPGHEYLRLDILFHAHQLRLALLRVTINFAAVPFMGLKTATQTSFQVLKWDSTTRQGHNHPAARHLQGRFSSFNKWLRDVTLSRGPMERYATWFEIFNVIVAIELSLVRLDEGNWVFGPSFNPWQIIREELGPLAFSAKRRNFMKKLKELHEGLKGLRASYTEFTRIKVEYGE